MNWVIDFVNSILEHSRTAFSMHINYTSNMVKLWLKMEQQNAWGHVPSILRYNAGYNSGYTDRHRMHQYQ